MLDKTITLYHLSDGVYTKKVITDCFYYGSDTSVYTTTEMSTTRSLYVIISTKENIEINQGFDIVVLGTTTATIDTSSEEATSLSIKQLKSNYKAFTINTAEFHLFGGLSNIELTCS